MPRNRNFGVGGGKEVEDAGDTCIPKADLSWYTAETLVAQMVKSLPAVRETWVRSLGWEDLLKDGMQPTPVFLPGESPRTEEPGGL